jgi:hypothetical protein
MTVSRTFSFSGKTVLLLVTCLTVNWACRRFLDDAGAFAKPYLDIYFKEDAIRRSLLNVEWYELFLPRPELRGTWSTTGFTLHFFLCRWFGPVNALFILQSFMVLSVFLSSLYASRCKYFAVLVAIGLGVTTAFHHGYFIAGAFNGIPMISFLMISIAAQWRIVTDGPSIGKVVASVISLALCSMAYEAWVSFVAWFIIVLPPALIFVRYIGDRKSARNLTVVSAIILGWFAVYLSVRLQPDYRHTFEAGEEIDLILGYVRSHTWHPLVDDLVSNFFQFPYMTLSLLIPPQFGGSLSLLLYDKTEISGFMLNYDNAFSDFAYYHHVFLWRYFAGAFAVVLALCFWRYAKYGYLEKDWRLVLMSMLIAAIFLGAGSHFLIKFRPLNALPYLYYKLPFGALVLYLTVAFWICFLLRPRLSHRKFLIVFAGAISWFLVCAVIKPEGLDRHLRVRWSEQVYPVPIKIMSK